MLTVLLVFHLIIVLALVGVILLQRSEGGALGSLGGGSGLSLISGRSAGNFLTKATAVLASLFMISCIVLTIMNKNISKERGLSAVEVVEQAIKNSATPIEKVEKVEKVAPPIAGAKEEAKEKVETTAVPPKPKAE